MAKVKVSKKQKTKKGGTKGDDDSRPSTTASTTSVPAIKVHMNKPHANAHFPSNYIVTSKYNPVTFIPLFFFEQFRKVSNFYFLVNCIYAFVPDVSPISPYSSLLPLVFVLGVACVKEVFEDYLRHKSDYRANSIPAHVLRKSGDHWELKDVPSRDVGVGDIVKIYLGEEIRADVLVLSTCLPEGSCFIDTCNLDGETNLKNRKATEETWFLDNVEALSSATLEIQTSAPSPALLSWTGMLTVNGVEAAVGLDQFLYRSAVLRSTDYIWGVVIYAGTDTKMFRNLAKKASKMSNLDKKLNMLITALLIVQHIFLFLLAGLAVWFNDNHKDHWYLRFYLEEREGIELWGYRYMSYFILMSYLIPISLFVTIEVCKVVQAQFMNWDDEMVEVVAGRKRHCNANSSDLNEQLAHVKYIFSDKTGTLTENIMNYKQGDILGNFIDSDNWETTHAYLTSPATRDIARRYWMALAICHTVQPFPSDHGLTYEGASPDEIALVKAAAQAGFILKDRTTRSMTIEEEGKMLKFEILATLEFTPDRKMMSIVVRGPDGSIQMYTKGADSFVIPNLASGPPNSDILASTEATLADMAVSGLRTLMVCTRSLTSEQFTSWNERFISAGKIIDNRAAEVDKVCLELENKMIVVGATAIEDKLQDQVPETLQFFLDAGVIVWMLTGDKRETAVTIAGTTSLCNPAKDAVVHVDVGDLHGDEAKKKCLQDLKRVKQAIDRNDRKVTFVIDGVALTYAMDQYSELFLEVSQQVSSAVCCRLTPLQKSRVVRMFQICTGSTAIAIGDGANDVSMIQEGKVGVGIVGLEGAQAALAADYAIPRFKHLRRLCMVHGRYSLYRNALCVTFSFYKNIQLALMQFIYAMWAGFSGQTLIDGWLLSFFNMAFTSLPPMAVGMFEKDLPEEVLMEKSSLFPFLAEGLYFDTKTMVMWFGEAVAHCLIIYFLSYPTQIRGDIGFRQADNFQHGTIIITSVIFVCLTKLALHIRNWTAIMVASMGFSYLFFLAFLICYNVIDNLFGYTYFYYHAFNLMSDPKLWLYAVLYTGGLLFPVDLATIYMQRQVRKTARDLAQEEYHLKKLLPE